MDTESLLKPLLKDIAVQRDVMSQVAMMQAVMLSRPNLEKVARQTDLFLDAPTRLEQERVIDELAGPGCPDERRAAGGRGRESQGGTFSVSFDGQRSEGGPPRRPVAARYLHGGQPRHEAH